MVKNSILKIGPDYIYIIGEILEANHINGKILYISDQIVDNMYGDIVCSQLKRFGDVEIQIINQDTISFAMCVAEYVITSDIDCIVGLGGGKVLDVCKYAAYISKRTLISIPTTIANDGIASPIAVLKRKDEKPKSIGCAVPNIIILDINLILNSPKQLIMAGIGDTISNYMALLDWEFACQKKKDEMNGYAYMMSKASLDSLLRTQYTSICPEFVKVLADSLILSGIAMDYAGSSRPVSGSEHLFSHALDYYSERKNLHGIQVALGTIAMLKLLKMDYSFVLNYLNRFQVNVNPSNLGIDINVFTLCMQKATTMRTNRYTYLNEMDLSTDILNKLYDELVEEL